MQRKISVIIFILFIITVLVLATLIGKTNNNISIYSDPVFVPQIIVRSAIVDWGFPQVTLTPNVYQTSS